MRWSSVLVIMVLVTNLAAQLPETDLWLFKIKTEKGQMKLGEGKNITSRKGYDNQPCFSADNKSIFYVSIQDPKQSDIYKYDIAKGTSVKFTTTSVSEYSPGYTPDQKFMSCLVVEADSAQRVWLYDLNGSPLKCFDESIDSIGYYTWLSSDTMLYYKLTEPHSLRSRNGTKEDKWICNAPCRAFKRVNGNTFIYAIKDSVTVDYRKYNTLLKKSEQYAVHKSVSEDFVWLKELGLVKSEGCQLLRYDEQKKTWDALFDFGVSGIKKITRFAFDPKSKLVVVVDNP